MLIQDIFMNVANALFLLGTLLLAAKVLKNKSSLKDFDFIGSFLTFLGSISMAIALWIMSVYFAFILSIPTVIFWGISGYYSRRK